MAEKKPDTSEVRVAFLANHTHARRQYAKGDGEQGEGVAMPKYVAEPLVRLGIAKYK